MSYGAGVCPVRHVSAGGGVGNQAGASCPVLDVSTGEVKVARGGPILISAAIGSCVAVGALDNRRGIGGIAHVMLPGEAPGGTGASERFRYARDAVKELMIRLEETGADMGRIVFCLVGGGNVLRREGDTICAANIASVRAILSRMGCTLGAESLGGFVRRRLRIDVADGRVFCGEGDGPERVLWRTNAD
jgi:chemotaxis protein CheD